MRLFSFRRRSDIEDLFSEYVIDALKSTNAVDVTDEAVTELADKAIEPFTDSVGTQVAERVIRNRRSFNRNRKLNSEFDKRLRRRWGQAFRFFVLTQACAQEAGERVQTKPTDALDDDRQACLHALISIHAKACRVTGEVYTLLANGFPEGALARCRTLHEFAVTANVIGSCAGDPVHGDLGRRFLEHAIVGQLRNARQYQQDHGVLKLAPLEADFLTDLEDRYRKVLEKYGREFGREYGWAKRYCPDDNFRALEEKAGMSHMRGYYQWASNEVHSGPRGLDLNISKLGGKHWLRVGKTNSGLAEPASMALNSLYQATVSLVVSGTGDVDLTDLVSLKSIDVLRRKTSKELFRAEHQISKEEEKFDIDLRIQD